MILADAQQVIREVDGRSYSYMQAWGLSTIREALRTIDDRKSATEADRGLAEGIRWTLARKW